MIGIPLRITVGRGAVDGLVEYKLRRDAEKEEIPVEDALKRAIEIVGKESLGIRA